MNARIKKLWVAALRSGKWRKANGELRKSSNYRCCLGVLDEVYMKDTRKGDWDTLEIESGELTEDVMRWAELSDSRGDSVTIDNELAPLSVHNDGEACRPKSQLEIADAIEAQL